MDFGITTRQGCKSLSFGFSSEKGHHRTENQDVAVIIPDMRIVFPTLCQHYNCTKNPFSFFAIFDGHGGTEAALFAEQHLPKMILYLLLREQKDLPEALSSAILHLDREYLATGKDDGTTLLVVLITPEGRLISANVGDCEGLIGSSKVESLCPLGPHNPRKNMGEVQRITLNGGTLSSGRLCHPILGTAKTIAVSRAIGDASFKQESNLICNPDLMERRLTGAENFIVLACDGLWDVFRLEEVALFLGPLLNPEEPDNQRNLDLIAEQLVYEAYRRGSTDNVTVILIVLD
jgi:serine/threonine protein phosphatase PrpC